MLFRFLLSSFQSTLVARPLIIGLPVARPPVVGPLVVGNERKSKREGERGERELTLPNDSPWS